jgi:MarR family transcriptional regulator for hemolysin
MHRKRALLTNIVNLARLIRTEADKRARAHGMTRAQWSILLRLQEQPGLLQKELAELLEVEPITVARLIDRLESRAMVERRPDPSDRRCWRLHLTDASRPLLGEINEQLADLAGLLCEGLSDDQVESVSTGVEHLRDRAQSQRSCASENPTSPDLDDVA